MQRIMYVWLPHLSTQRLIRQQPDLAHKFFALTQKIGNRVEVTALSPVARAKGFIAGGSLSDLRVVDPSLSQFEAAPDKDLKCLRLLVRWACRYSPMVARCEGEGFFLNMTGATHLIGTEDALIKDISLRLAQMGFTAQIGLAPTAAMAWSVAHFEPDQPIVVPDQFMARARHLPLEALKLDDHHIQLARSLGLKNLNDMMRLPRGGVASRFSLKVLERLDQITGQTAESIDYANPRQRYDVAREFVEPIGHIEGVEQALEDLLTHLCAHLQSKGKGALLLRLIVERVDHQALHFEVRTLKPTIHMYDLKRLFLSHLDMLDVGFGIEKMQLLAHKTAPLNPEQTQLQASVQTKKSPLSCTQLINQLTNRYGVQSVISYRQENTHIPEKIAQPVPALYAQQDADSWLNHAARRPVKLWQKPHPVLVRPRHPSADARYAYGDDDAQTAVPQYIYLHSQAEPITALSGPERIEPLWFFDDPEWRTGPRDYWWVLSATGALLWIYRTTQPHQIQWFLHGLGA